MRDAIHKTALKEVYDKVAGRYDFQHGFLTAGSDQRGRRILVDHAVRPGETVLDCGAGTGSTSLLALEKVGLSGSVVLFDFSDGMLGVAKRRIEELAANAPVDFISGDMHDLPFEDNSFDTVLCTYSLCPIDDPARGAGELYRVTKPGGRIGIAHSAEPTNPVVKWAADRVENLIWHLPSISLGCRSVAVLPVFEQAGCRIIFNKHLGIPLWPFFVFIAEKPTN